MATIFTKIIQGEIPCYKIAEDDRYLAMLDINPLKEGHTLIVPKKEIDYIFDIDDSTLSGMMVFAKKVAIALKSVVECKRIGVVVIGLEVPHAHIHLIPMNSEGDLSFSKPRVKLTSQELSALSEKIGAKVVL
jgi:histidine triad (HIT) family protein